MTRKQTGQHTFFKASVIIILFMTMAGLIAFKGELFHSDAVSDEGLSGLVSVKGTVKVEDLDLSKSEIKKINRAVSNHKKTFTQVDLFLDVKDGSSDMNKTTTLVWAMVLETNGECEVRSWSRKVPRGELVAQMVIYMNKAAKEYEEFKQFPDVKQNFKCLYI